MISGRGGRLSFWNRTPISSVSTTRATVFAIEPVSARACEIRIGDKKVYSAGCVLCLWGCACMGVCVCGYGMGVDVELGVYVCMCPWA